MEKWTRHYYRWLVIGLLAFAGLLAGFYFAGASSPFLLSAFFLFYLAYKNGLQAWVKNQIAKEDPAYSKRRNEAKKQKREMWKVYLLPRSPWYKNESIIVVLLLILAFLFRFR